MEKTCLNNFVSEKSSGLSGDEMSGIPATNKTLASLVIIQLKQRHDDALFVFLAVMDLFK